MKALRMFYALTALAIWSMLCIVTGAMLHRAQAQVPVTFRSYVPASAATILQCPISRRGLEEWQRDCRERARLERARGG